MKSIIVIGDVHGCYQTLLKLIEQFPAGVPIAFVGDLVDRGLSSRQVVEYVKDNGHDCVQGNHESMMIQHIRDSAKPEHKGAWSSFVSNGGQQTLDSYIGHEEKLTEHVEWMEKLPLFIEYPEIKNDKGRYLVISHSSVGSVWHWNEQKLKTNQGMFAQIVQWGRNTPQDAQGIYNIFGHTPQEEGARIKSFYANVDTGACFARDFSELYGVLSAVQFPEMKLYTQRNVENNEQD